MDNLIKNKIFADVFVTTALRKALFMTPWPLLYFGKALLMNSVKT